jgi:hypothetical protein
MQLLVAWLLTAKTSFGEQREGELVLLKDETSAQLKPTNGGNECHTPAYRLTACTQVRDDLAYLIDWIEYYRIIGPITTFVIYDDRSADNVTLLQTFYQARGVNVTVITAPSEEHLGVDGQTQSFSHCLMNFVSDWTIVLDSDEFIWAPNHCTIASWLSVQNPRVKMHEVSVFDCSECLAQLSDQLQVRDNRFGTSQQRRQGYHVTQDENGRVTVKNEFGPQSQLEGHINRGPSPYGPASEIELYSHRQENWEGCRPPWYSGWDICSQNIEFGKTIYKWGSCDNPESPHKCYDEEEDPRGLDGSVAVHNQSELRCNHYYIRSKEDAYIKSEKWEKSDPKEMYEKSDAYWNSVADTALKDLIGDRLRQALQKVLAGD